MAVGDVIECKLCNYDSVQNALNVTHWRVATVTGTEPTLLEKVKKVAADYVSYIKPQFSSQWTYKGVKGRQVSPVVTAEVIDTTGTGVGGLAGDLLPGQLAMVLSLRSSVAPPRIRGRMYLPSPTEAENSAAGQPTAAYITAITTAASNFLSTTTVTGGGGGSCTLVSVIFHRKAPQASYAIDQILVRGNWGTQRRRSSINRADVSAI